MIDFSNFLDLPLVWGVLIAIAVFMYAVLDGFDLGCGILFPFAPSDTCRHKMMNSIAPFWDGNETWLVLGGGGLLVAFPVAYSVLLPALYLPIMLMLFGLIFRGVAFEFRFKAGDKDRKFWDAAFHFGSLVAAFMQGVVLGNFIQGVEVEGRNFAGGAMDWANGFAFFTGGALIFGYALLGATWLVMKTDGETQAWARKAARYVLSYVVLSMVIVAIAMPMLDERIAALWFESSVSWFLIIIALASVVACYVIWRDVSHDQREVRPFLVSILVFLLGYIGFGVSLYPWIVPFEFTLWSAAAVSTSQSFTLIGAVIMLPVILGYTAFCYYIFRGKSDDKAMY